MAKESTEIVPHKGWTAEQVALIKKTVANGASNDELALFLQVAKRSGLDPFSKQIHFVKRGDRATIQTGIDGYRAIAERSNTLGGIDDAIFDSEEGKSPKKASVTVYRILGGQRVGFTASARWSEYAPMFNGRLSPMWEKMPYLMLAKCAEALALRKAFPNDLSGLYTHEEMQQASGYDTSVVEDDAPIVVTGTDTDEPAPELPAAPVQQVSIPLVTAENSAPWRKPDAIKKVMPSAEKILLMQKTRIKDLVDSIVLAPISTKEEYQEYVLNQTGLELQEENFERIIVRLEEVQTLPLKEIE